MYCKNCGKLIGEGDKFCSGCGTKVDEPAQFDPERKPETPSQDIIGERPKRNFHIEDINWDLDGYPTGQVKKTEEIDFNWASVLEEKQRRALREQEEKAARDFEQKPKEETETETETEEIPLEELIFGKIEKTEEAEADEPTRILERTKEDEDKKAETQESVVLEYDDDQMINLPKEESHIDKFYTFNKKNEEFQALLDQEYERLKNSLEDDAETIPDFAGNREAAADNTDTEEQPPEKADEEVSSSEEDPIEEIPPADIGGSEYIGVAAPETPKHVIAFEQEATSAQENEQACPPSQNEEETEEEPGRRLTFDDVFRDDDDDAEEVKPKKKGKALKIIFIILSILIVLELIMIGIQYFAKGTPIAEKLNNGYMYVVDLFTGGDEDQAKGDDQNTEISEIAGIIHDQMDKNKNIGDVTENQDILFDDKKDYGFKEIKNAYTFANKSWYTDDEGKSVDYGDEIIGTLISYYSSWIDKANGENDKALSYIMDTSDFYTEIENLKASAKVKYGINKLEIGEIRSSEKGFYILTRITKATSTAKKETIEDQIVYMEPEKQKLKIVEIKKI